MNKKDLNERDICSKFITPAILKAGWDLHTQIREEVRFTKGRIIVRGKLVPRGKDKRADYILYYKPDIPIAIVEAKDNLHPMGGTSGTFERFPGLTPQKVANEPVLRRTIPAWKPQEPR